MPIFIRRIFLTTINQLYSRLVDAMGVDGLEIPMTAVKFYKKEDEIPAPVKENQPSISLTSCQATKQASLGDAAFLTYDNIGCVAAAITFGLVDKDRTYWRFQSIYRYYARSIRFGRRF